VTDTDPNPTDRATASIKGALARYRFMATVVGVLLIVLILIGVPLANFDGSGMWGVFPSTPEVFEVGSSAHDVGEAITTYLGVAHGWLYMIFLVAAFLLSRKAKWDVGFTVVTLICGTIPIVSFWAEHRATKRVRAEWLSTGPE
jgi:integral membrane protein